MAQGGGSAATDKQLETVVETIDQLLEAEGPESHGRELDREWDTVEAACQLDHGSLVLQGDLEGGTRLPCALDEQGDGFRLGDPVRRMLASGSGTDNGPTWNDRLTVDAEGLGAGRQDPQRRRLP